jgi:hypothetical protein
MKEYLLFFTGGLYFYSLTGTITKYFDALEKLDWGVSQKSLYGGCVLNYTGFSFWLSNLSSSGSPL